MLDNLKARINIVFEIISMRSAQKPTATWWVNRVDNNQRKGMDRGKKNKEKWKRQGNKIQSLW